MEKTKIDFRKFTVNDLILKYDLWGQWINVVLPIQMTSYDVISLGDAMHFSVDQGSENLYVRLDAYIDKDPDGTEHSIELWTKDGQDVLKQILKDIIEQL